MTCGTGTEKGTRPEQIEVSSVGNLMVNLSGRFDELEL
ncbi:hypothetical protein SS05631_c14200 [Sinorhizobium sp. CCBAU 05631]|nr:hypothetical protein SS05631_c14200 [Sinorhizobium sp. CCBAU 05631]